MKALWSPLVSQVSGSMGSLCAASNRYGFYLRYRNGPDNSASTYWQAIRDNNLSLMARWQSLTGDKRFEWCAASQYHLRSYSFGKQSTLPGYNYYLSVNNNRFLCGLSPDDTPPPYGVAVMPDNLELSSNVSLQNLELSYTNSLTNEYYTKIFITKPLPASLTYYRNEFRFLESSGTEQLPSLDISSSYAARFLLPFAVGDVIVVKLVNFNSNFGACSQPFEKRFVIAT